ncbi:DUF6701 domain-containing protein [Neptunicella marina]|uniref:MSHA biogenesis protein MshQ n=1 Tax=Neptunicella marina TaxID=2125989 RepID=A0A8J6M4I6_9ALTE|nr:DUF6701 domain-containing protein [Neptunicella marina]MBC3766116.1 hypothetical protein [Neptunicella marina]
MKWFKYLFVSLLTLLSHVVQATDYNLPADVASLPGSCSGSGSSINCSGNLIFNSGDRIFVSQPLQLNISGDLTFGTSFGANAGGLVSNLTIVVAGNVNPGPSSEINASLTVSGSINSNVDVHHTGAMVITGNLNLGNGSTVRGNIQASTLNIGDNATISGNINAGTITVGQGSRITGDIQTTNININGSNSVVDGNINATGTVVNNGTVTGYVNADTINDNSNGITDTLECDIDTSEGPNTGPCAGGQLAQWFEFEEAGWSGANSVVDSSANRFNGQALGNVSLTLSSNPIACQAINVPYNNSTSQTDAIDTRVNINSLGTKGTISFWYKSQQNWRSSGFKTLMDATNISGNPDYYFAAAIDQNGRINFVVQDGGARALWEYTGEQNFTAGSWVHIALTYDFPSRELGIFINGNESSAGRIVENGFDGSMGTFNTLYIGDSHANFTAYGANYALSSANGEFDNVRIYSQVQTQSQINTDRANNTVCSTTPVAHYQFEQNNWNSADTVLDSSVNHYNGSAIGAATPVFPSIQKSCKVLNVPASSSTTTNNAVDTQFPLSQSGSRGTISFWYRSNQTWNSGVARQLLDASTDTQGNANDKYFFLTLTDQGRLRFGLEDSDDNDLDVYTQNYAFAANEWVHIGISWNVATSTLNIVVNGNQANLVSNNGILNGQIAGFNSLYIGDNRSGYVLTNLSGTANSADGQFDDVRIYNRQLTTANIAQDMANVTPCEQQVVFYEFEELSWDSTGDVKDGSGNDNNGTAYGSATPLFPSNQISCRVLDVPYNNTEGARSAVDTNIDVNDIGDKGTISFWYKSNSAWNSGQSRQLFDGTNASTQSVGTDQVFFLTLSEQGRLHFSLEDSDDLNLWVSTNTRYSFAANQWVHIGVTWDLPNQRLLIYVNGVQQGTSGVTETGVGPYMGDYAHLYFGDSSTNYVIANQPHTHNSANGQFDDVRIYNFAQTATQISTDSSQTKPCGDATIFYKFEQNRWSGANTVLDSSGNDHHGSPLGRVRPIFPSTQKSCLALWVPNNTSYSTQDGVQTNFDLNQLGNAGTISFWYQSAESWTGAGRTRILLEATQDANSMFVLGINSSGQVVAQVAESDGDYKQAYTNSIATPSATWTHIAVAWDAVSDKLIIYINGQNVTAGISGAFLDEGLANVGNLIIGDNSTTSSSYSPSGNSADGYFDDVRIYSYVQSATEVDTDMNNISPCSYVDHYRLEIPSETYNCALTPVTVKACGSNDCSVLYDQVSSLRMYSDSGTFSQTDLTFTGSTQTILSSPNVGQVVLGISRQNPFAALKCYKNGVLDNCIIDVKKGGLTLSWQTKSPTQNIPDQLAQKALDQVLYVTNDSGGACAANLQGKELQVGVICNDPNSCHASMLNLGGTQRVNTDQFNSTGIYFDASGEAAIPANFIRYDDAGQIQLKARDSAGLTGGVSNQFISIPDLKLSYLENTSDPANSKSLITAGIEFGLQLTAVGQNDIVTPNYVPHKLQMTVIRNTPATGGVEGILGVTSAGGNKNYLTGSVPQISDNDSLLFNVTNGQSVDVKADYSEVGQITLNLQDADYFGYQPGIQSPLILARFIPAYFDISDNTPLLSNTCTSGGFSYVGQELSFATEPEFTYLPFNAKQQPIHNYIGDLMRLNAPGAIAISSNSILFAESSAFNAQGSILQTIDKGTLNNLNAGDPILKLKDARVKYVLDTKPLSPFVSEIELSLSVPDDDGVCYNRDYAVNPTQCDSYQIHDIAGADLRYGRLRLFDTYGAETESVDLPMTTEYFNSSGNWVTNDDDSCTTFDASNLHWHSSADHSTNQASDIPAFSNSGTFFAGKSNSLFDSINIAAPGAGNALSFPVIMDEPDYLYFDWEKDGNLQRPTAIVTFGHFRGNDRLINWREVF